MCMWPSIRPRTSLHGECADPRRAADVEVDLRVRRAAAARHEREAPARAGRGAVAHDDRAVARHGEHLPRAAGRSIDEVAARLAHAPVGGLARRRRALHAVAGLPWWSPPGGRAPGWARSATGPAAGAACRRRGSRASRRRGGSGRGRSPASGTAPPARPAGRDAVPAVRGLGDELAGRGRLQRVAAADAASSDPAPAHRPRTRPSRGGRRAAGRDTAATIHRRAGSTSPAASRSRVRTSTAPPRAR